jgi:hypothetical protein
MISEKMVFPIKGSPNLVWGKISRIGGIMVGIMAPYFGKYGDFWINWQEEQATEKEGGIPINSKRGSH